MKPSDRTLWVLTFFTIIGLPFLSYVCHAEETVPVETTLDEDFKGEKVGLKTDDDVIDREEVQMNHDGFSVAEKKLLRGEEKHEFQAEIKRLMGIIINSLYSNRDIFLREVISNASDALDKIRFASLTDREVLGNTPELEIRIRADPENNQIHIRDTGVGMTTDDLVANLGKIAQSGTRDWIDRLQGGGDLGKQIGQFGVGFYSTFLVADQVFVTTKHNDDKQQVWSSAADTSYTIGEDPRGDTLGRGTVITLQLKDDAKEFLEPENLKKLVAKYSAYIDFPIYVWESEEIEEEVPVEDEDEEEADLEEDEEEEEETDEIEIEEEDEDEEEEDDEPKTKTVKRTVWKWSLVNMTKPLWTRSKNEIEEEEYNEFYKSMTKDYKDPLAFTHFKAEGDVEFTGLLYVPSEAPSGMFQDGGKKSDLKLYVRRVFITSQFKDIMPQYLSFVKGLVDSDDLPLNVSREQLQQSKSLNVIKKKVIRKAIALFQKLSKDPEKYEQFYKNFHTNLKLGMLEDAPNKTRLSKLLRFYSSNHADEQISLTQYVEEMKEGQDKIYFLGGETKEAVQHSPLLEKLNAQGKDVLLMTEPIDEYAMQVLEKFDGKYKVVNIAKEGLDLDNEDIKDIEEEFKPVTEYMKKSLGSTVGKVKVTNRLTTTPCALVAASYGISANMERIYKAQALSDAKSRQMYSYSAGARTLEINHRHPIIKEMQRLIAEDDENSTLDDLTRVLYDTAVLNSGYALEKPTQFASLVHKLLTSKLDIEGQEVEPEPEATEEVEDAEEVEEAEEVEAEEEPVEEVEADEVEL